MHNQHSEPQGTQEDWKRRAERAETQLADAMREVERLTNASIADGTRRFLCSQELAFAFQAWRERMDKELRNSVSCETYRAVWADCEQLRAEVARLSGRDLYLGKRPKARKPPA